MLADGTSRSCDGGTMHAKAPARSGRLNVELGVRWWVWDIETFFGTNDFFVTSFVPLQGCRVPGSHCCCGRPNACCVLSVVLDFFHW